MCRWVDRPSLGGQSAGKVQTVTVRCPTTGEAVSRAGGHRLLYGEVGYMEYAQTDLMCPTCGTLDAPTLVVRGTGLASPAVEAQGIRFRCRHCRWEWARHYPDWRRAS
jgi:hypothetical protein